MIRTASHIWQKRAIIRYFVSNLLTTSYRTKSLGFLWALLSPLLFMCVYYLVFSRILGHRPLWFMLHIYLGVISFRFLTGSITQSAHILKSQAGLIRDIAFPKAVLPVAVVTTRLFDLCAGWAGAIVIGAIFHVLPTPLWALAPAIILIQLILVLGLSFLTAYVGVFFADIDNILEVVTRLWFYLSPVLYFLSEMQDRTADTPLAFKLLLLNPMAGIMNAYDYAVFSGHPAVLLSMEQKHSVYLAPGPYLAISLAEAILILVVGYCVFARAQGRIEKYV